MENEDLNQGTDVAEEKLQGHWSENLQSEELKSEEAQKVFKKYDAPEGAHKALLEAQKIIGQPFRLPKDIEKLSDEQRAEIKGFYDRSYGVPTDAEGYDLKFDVGLDENIPVDSELSAMFPQWAKENDFTKAQAQAGIELWNKMVSLSMKKMEETEAARKAETEKIIHAKWGEDKDNKLALIKRALQHELGLKPGDEADVDPKWVEFHNDIYLKGLQNNAILLSLCAAGAETLEREGKMPRATMPGSYTTETGERLSGKARHQRNVAMFGKETADQIATQPS